MMRIGLKFNFRMIRQCKESERESDNGAEIFPQTKWKESEMPGRMHVIKMWSKTEGMELFSSVHVENRDG